MSSGERVEQFKGLIEHAAYMRIGRRGLIKAVGMSAGTTMIGGLLAACGAEQDDDSAEGADTDDSEATEDTDESTDSEDEEDPATEEPDEDDSSDEEGEARDVEGVTTGGTFASYMPEDPPGLDPHGSSSQGQSEFSAYSYSRLYMLASGPDIPDGSLDTVPDLAESADISEDGLTYTFSLNADAMFHPPLERQVTADDVIFSFNYLAGEAGVEESTRFDRLRIVESIEAIDDTTVEMVLAEPYPFFLATVADPKVMFILPQEGEDEINLSEEMIGSGPWILEEYSPNSVARFRRNENWHLGPDLPYMNEVEVNMVPEYATQLNQFMGGNLDWVQVEGPDLPRVEESIPDVQIYQLPEYPLSVLNFSPREERWRDERLRWAVSMALDRDAMLDAAYGLAEMEDAGIEVRRNWHTWVPVGFSEFWLDPKTEMDEESAQYLQYNPERARELVEEAGGGFSTQLHYTAERYGEPYRIMSELTVTYLNDIGIECEAVEEDYNSTFIPESAQGEFDGMMWIQQTRVDPMAYFQTQYLNTEHGLYSQWSNDEELVERLNNMRAMTDFDELREEIRDIQNVLAQKMYVVPMQFGAAPLFYAFQPWVQNALDYQSFAQGGATEEVPNFWLDQ